MDADKAKRNSRRDFSVDCTDLPFEKSQMFETHAQHSAVVDAQTVPFERLQNLRDLRPRLALSQIGNRRQIRFTVRHPGGAEAAKHAK